VDVHLDAGGLRVDTHSLTSILAGGIAFQTPARAGEVQAATEETRFELYPSRELALKHPDTVVQEYILVFDSSVRGLAVGAPLDFRGIVVGEVKAISLEFDPARKAFVSPVEVRFYPERLSARLRGGSPDPREVISDVRERLDTMVANGLRGQLRSASLLTGQLYVALDFIPDAPRATMDWDATPPRLPTASNGLDELQASLTRIANRLEQVPFDAIGADLRQALQTLDRLLKSADRLVVHIDQELGPELRAAVSSTRRTLETVEQSLASDAPLQQGMQDTLHEVSRAAASLRALTDYLERHPEALIRGKKEDLP
jgi:paraquat-inducible protein B